MLSPILTVEPSKKSVKETLALADGNKGSVRGFKIRLGYVKTFAYDAVFDDLYRVCRVDEPAGPFSHRRYHD